VVAFLVSAFHAGLAILAIGVAIAVIGTRRVQATENSSPHKYGAIRDNRSDAVTQRLSMVGYF